MSESKDIAASVRARLNNQARSTGELFQNLILRYAQERFLYRLGCSHHRDSFILKGATLFLLWEGAPHRRTKDIDFLRFGSSDEEELKKAITEVCTHTVEADGMAFDLDSLSISPIRELQEYDGHRIELMVSLGQAKFKLWMDVGFGDSVKPTKANWPSILDAPEPEINVYPREAVIAEKFHAIVKHGMANSRMKDFFDVHFLATNYEFLSTQVTDSISATFERRRDPLPDTIPVGLTEDFANDETKKKQWTGFLKKNAVSKLSLQEAVDVTRRFIWPLIKLVKSEKEETLVWEPGGDWRSKSDN